MSLEESVEPRYLAVKKHVLGKIKTGSLRPGDRVPSENELVGRMGVARMTVNRAIRELTQEGYLTRRAGSGTFVARKPVYANPLEIHNIREEIKRRGGQHSVTVLHHEEEVRDDFPGHAKGGRVFHSIIIHHEDGIPVQLEDRLVDPDIAPDYLDQDFTRETAGEYLNRVAPLQQVEHIVEAILPDAATAADLKIGHRTACLVVTRKTWAAGRLASVARLYHPGNRFRLGGRFKPQ